MKLNKPIEILYYVNYRKTDGGTIIDSGVRQQLLECSVEDIMEFRMDKSEGLYPIMETVPKQPEEDEAEESVPEESVPEESGAPC